MSLQQVRMHTAARFIEVGHHVHSHYEAILEPQGTVQYADDVKTAIVHEGDFQLYAPHVPHAWATQDTACLRFVLLFEVTPHLPVNIQQGPVDWPELLWDTALLVNEVREGFPGWPTRVTARLTALLSRSSSLAEWPFCAPQPFEEETNLLARIDQFQRDNLHRPLTLVDIAVNEAM